MTQLTPDDENPVGTWKSLALCNPKRKPNFPSVKTIVPTMMLQGVRIPVPTTRKRILSEPIRIKTQTSRGELHYATTRRLPSRRHPKQPKKLPSVKRTEVTMMPPGARNQILRALHPPEKTTLVRAKTLLV
jgi:hypothetical protein